MPISDSATKSNNLTSRKPAIDLIINKSEDYDSNPNLAIASHDIIVNTPKFTKSFMKLDNKLASFKEHYLQHKLNKLTPSKAIGIITISQQ